LLPLEIEGKVTRHKYFAVVDRTQLVVAPELTRATQLTSINPSNQAQWVTLNPQNQSGTGGLGGSITYSTGTQVSWQIGTGSILVVNRGQPDEETVVVTNIDTTNPLTPKLEAIFRRDHNTNNTTIPPNYAPIIFTMPGNPGPKPNWSPWDYLEYLVVPYWEYLGQG
jgi:hypothetical protein